LDSQRNGLQLFDNQISSSSYRFRATGRQSWTNYPNKAVKIPRWIQLYASDKGILRINSGTLYLFKNHNSINGNVKNLKILNLKFTFRNTCLPVWWFQKYSNSFNYFQS
jgi:hypothetical protein